MTHQWLTFSQLSTQNLYDLLALREDVFQLEQACLYQDLDYQDQHALHLLIYDNDLLAGYLRLFTPDSAKELSATPNQAGAYSDKHVCRFGRFVTSRAHRGTGLGKKLINETLDYCQKHYPDLAISIAAQQYLEKFYQHYGFITTSEPYDDFGVLHVDMVKSPPHQGH